MARLIQRRRGEPSPNPGSENSCAPEGLGPSPHAARSGMPGEERGPGRSPRFRRGARWARLLTVLGPVAIGAGLLFHYGPDYWAFGMFGRQMAAPEPIAEPPPYSLRAAWRDVGRSSQPSIPAAARSMADVPLISVLEDAPGLPMTARDPAAPSGAALLAERMSSPASNRTHSAPTEMQAAPPPPRDARAPEPASPRRTVSQGAAAPNATAVAERPQAEKIPQQKDGRSALGGPMAASIGNDLRQAPVVNRRKPLSRTAPGPVGKADRHVEAARAAGPSSNARRRAVPSRRPRASMSQHREPAGGPGAAQTTDGQPLGGTAVFQGLGRAMP